MTVAAFFKDSRVRNALAGSRPTQASSIVQDFFALYDYADCSAAELLALADLSARCGDDAVARTALKRLVQSGRRLHLAHYKLGRMDAFANDFAAAADNFRAGTQADPDFAYNWIGAARALSMLGRKDEACGFAERFVTFGVRPHAASELAVLADLGDYLFDAGDRRRSLKLYELVVKFAADKPRDAVRLAEAFIAHGDHEAAAQVLLTQDKRGRLDNWGRRALAVAFSHVGEHARAIELGLAVAQADPANRGFVATYLDVLARAHDADLLRDAMAQHGDLLGQAGVTELTARIHLADNNIEAAAECLTAEEFEYQGRRYYLCFETAYAALGAGLLDIAQTLATRLGAVAPHDTFVKLLRIDSFFRQQMWEEGGEILAGMTAEEREKPHVILKSFEYASFVGDIPRAEALREQLETMELPSRQFLLPVFRYLAERGRWDDLVDRALNWLDLQMNYAQIGYVLFRAAKHTGRHPAIIAAVEALEGWQQRPDLVRLRASLAYDRAETLPEIERLSRDPTVAGDDGLRRKLDIKRAVLARAMAQSRRRAIFLCTDRNYLAATFVALHSLTRVTSRAGVDFFIVLDDDLVELAQRAAAAFIDAGFNIAVVAASSVIETAEKLYASYGLFTSGHVLSSAAYYRIYFAKYLAGLNAYERAIYVDSDVLVRGPLDPLFVADLGGHPLAARLEPMRPEVRRAIALHGLQDNRYFNSGVLVFDLQHERLAADLDGAVAAIMDDSVTLLFHDQCALNLGFRNDFADLDKMWNSVVTEPTKLADIPPDAAILHFLDRPKPWSAAHAGDAAILWFERWRETAAFIGEETAVDLFALIAD
jgi:lipopolysaccharide biosynthesis glycosyltransferase